MAVYVSGTVTVGTTPTVIASPGDCLTMLISNTGATVFLGGPNVTTATGLPVLTTASATIPVTGDAQATLYGIVASTTTAVSYLYVV